MLAYVFVPGCRSRCPSSLIVTGNRLFPPTREDWFLRRDVFFFFWKSFQLLLFDFLLVLDSGGIDCTVFYASVIRIIQRPLGMPWVS